MEVLQKPNETYYLMTLEKLQEFYQPIGLDIYSFLTDMLNINSSNPLTFTKTDQIIVLSLDLMTKVTSIVNNYLLTPEKSHIVVDHLLFSLVFDLSSHLSTAFEKIILPLFKELYGVEALPERWEYCVKETDAAFGYGLGSSSLEFFQCSDLFISGSLYVKAVFGETDRQQANELIRNIRQMFEENLHQLEWIDDASRTEAKKKLMKITEKVGFPDFINNKTKLNERLVHLLERKRQVNLFV